MSRLDSAILFFAAAIFSAVVINKKGSYIKKASTMENFNAPIT